MNYEKEILDYVWQHPGSRIQDMVAGTKCTYTEIVGVIEDMVDVGQLERWYSFGMPYFYIPGMYTPPHLRGSEAKTMKNEAQLQYEKRDSITLKRNAKGEYVWDAKLYWNSEDADALSFVEELQHIDKMLREAFL